ncbi:MAG: hypothetical protein KAW02_00340 [candidate division Zixibacteria bacterium]|nr:hypothetical protein [candidate division Zixibacteria bacterium]
MRCKTLLFALSVWFLLVPLVESQESIEVSGVVVDSLSHLPLDKVEMVYQYYDWAESRWIKEGPLLTDAWGSFMLRFDKRFEERQVNYFLDRPRYAWKKGGFILKGGSFLELTMSPEDTSVGKTIYLPPDTIVVEVPKPQKVPSWLVGTAFTVVFTFFLESTEVIDILGDGIP